MNAVWSFPNNNHSIRYGISDSGIETFKGRIEQSLAREICQNSLDAAHPNKRVRIEFELHKISSSDFPGKKEFKRALEKARNSWSSQSDSKTIDFLDNALIKIESNTIPYLRISDYNTTGLTGSDQKYNSNWSNLIKASGSSDKSSTAGGSFGIGKFATFAASNFRTVFYSTIDENGLEASQGVAKLVSFPNEPDSDELTQGIGFYGNPEKHEKIPSCETFVNDYKRTDVGTDIFIPGFIVQNEWEEKVIIEVLESFLMAIFDGTLDVSVGQYSISKETLNIFFEKHHDMILHKSKDLLAQYHVLKNKKTEWFDYSFAENNDVRIGILVDEDNAKNSKVSMIRRPWMKIYDYKPNNSNYFIFSGVCLIQGKKMNEMLRKAENPQHIQWEPNRIENNPNAKKLVKEYLKKIKSIIVDQINNLIARDSEDESDIEGVSDYLPMRESGTDDKDITVNGMNYRLKKKTKKAILTSKTLSEKVEDRETDEMIEIGLIDGDDTFINIHHGNGSSGIGNQGDFPKGIEDNGDILLSIPQKSGEYTLRLFSTTGNHNKLKLVLNSHMPYKKLNIKFFKLDEDGKSLALKLKQAIFNNLQLKVSNHSIQNIELDDNLSIIDLVFDEKIPFTAEVKLYAIKK